MPWRPVARRSLRTGARAVGAMSLSCPPARSTQLQAHGSITAVSRRRRRPERQVIELRVPAARPPGRPGHRLATPIELRPISKAARSSTGAGRYGRRISSPAGPGFDASPLVRRDRHWVIDLSPLPNHGANARKRRLSSANPAPPKPGRCRPFSVCTSLTDRRLVPVVRQVRDQGRAPAGNVVAGNDAECGESVCSDHEADARRERGRGDRHSAPAPRRPGARTAQNALTFRSPAPCAPLTPASPVRPGASLLRPAGSSRSCQPDRVPPLRKPAASKTLPWRRSGDPAPEHQRRESPRRAGPSSSRGGRIRTADLLLPKQARCQAAPRPATVQIMAGAARRGRREDSGRGSRGRRDQGRVPLL